MINDFISIIVPCFNEEAVINETNNRLKKVALANFTNYEIIYVNDGSFDSTFNILEALSKGDSNIKIINFSRNFGHQAAVSAGIKNCNGDAAIIIDADLQDPPELFPDIINTWKENNCNVVNCVRQKRLGETIFKKVTAKIFYRLLNKLSEIDIPLDTGDFRLIDRKVIEAFKRIPEKNKYIRGLFAWVGFKHVPFYYTRQERFAGSTKYPLYKMLKFSANGIMYFSKKPLEIVIGLGLIFLVFDVFLASYILYLKFNGETIAGWTSSILINIFLSAINLICLGIIGKYLGIIFEEIKNRPEYVIENKTNFNDI